MGEDTGLLELSLEDRRESYLMGLDGVYRVSRQSPDAPPVAVKGEWLSEKESGLTYNDFTTVETVAVRAVFQGEEISLKLAEPHNDLDMVITGRARR